MALVKQFIKRGVSKTSLFTKNAPQVSMFHSSGFVRDKQDTEKSPSSFIEKAGLDDWKIAGPLGLVVAIPAISNGIYVLNEESQLACCFILFCTSVYKYGGEAIGNYFDAQSKAILEEHQAIEKANMEAVQETLDTYKQQLDIVDDIDTINAAHKEVVELLCKVGSAKLKHTIRDNFVKNLDSIANAEKQFNVKLQANMVKFATDEVRKVIEGGSASVKEDAFKSAINVLNANEETGGKKDAIVQLFIDNLHKYSKGLEEKTGKVVKLTDDEMKMVQSEMDAYMQRNEVEVWDLKAQREVTLGLPGQ